MHDHPRAAAEQGFAIASAKAAQFELRMRLLGGAVPKLATLPIDIKLSKLRDELFSHYSSVRTLEESNLIEKACTLRNKLLHGEFSSARGKLNELGPRTRRGGVYSVNVEGMSHTTIVATLEHLAAGGEEGKVHVAHTTTQHLKDVFGWLLESFAAGEFEEAAEVFERSMQILDRWRNSTTGSYYKS